MRWVRRPLHIIMESLTQNDPKPIEPLSKDHSEFGQLARTLRTFFAQRDNLIREMELHPPDLEEVFLRLTGSGS